jgi:hypothetical protein
MTILIPAIIVGMDFKKPTNRIPNNQLSEVVLEQLVIPDNFKTTLNIVLNRKKEILEDFSLVEIVVNERNEVLKGALDVIVLRGLAKEFHNVKVLSSSDTIKSGRAIFKEMGISEIHHNNPFSKLFDAKPKRKD